MTDEEILLLAMFRLLPEEEKVKAIQKLKEIATGQKSDEEGGKII